ncbi:MAG: aldehyde dehydrogenase family protein [Halioglobus sp.]|nr:aldehyde dehydrogenase family protein [Halioglobus sp.]
MKFSMTINGEAAATEATFAVLNPATEEVVAQCPAASSAQVEAAVAAAKEAFKSWKNTTRAERNAMILQLAEAIEAHADELAELLTLEQGKPLNNALTHEVGPSAQWCRAITAFDLPVKVLEDTETHRSELHHRPMGVVVGITPWNYPLNTAVWKILPAVATGNTVIVKPSPYTPLTTLKLGELIRDIFPPGVINIITGDNAIGQQLTEHPDIAKITLTGSVPTGKKVMAAGAMSNLKSVTLELGGNDPAIVLPDVDLKSVLPRLFWYSFLNTGQVCISIKRLYVHADIYDAVCEGMVAMAKGVVIGDGMKEGVMLGPVQNKMQFDKLVAYINSVEPEGGRFLCGGHVPEGKGYFLPVSIAVDLPDDATLVKEEPFGPILPILKFTDTDDVIRRANDSPLGLGASVWSADVDEALRIAAQIEAGSVWVNHHLAKKPVAPFGGIKQSGIGVENSEWGLAEFTNLQVIGVQK